MRRRVWKYVLMLCVMGVMGVMCASCYKNTIYGTGMQVEDVRTIIGGYTKVKVRDGLVLVVDPSLSKDMVMVRCDEELLPYVSVTTSLANELCVDYKNAFSFATPLETEVHIPQDNDVVSYDLRNSEMHSLGALQQDSLSVKVVNSTVGVNLNVKNLQLVAEDKSEVRLWGGVSRCYMTVDDSKVNALTLIVNKVWAQLSRADVDVWCRDELNAVVTGASELRYDGGSVVNVEASSDSKVENLTKK